MKYKNIKTGFVFESNTEVKGEDWVELSPLPSVYEENEPKPAPKRRKKEVK